VSYIKSPDNGIPAGTVTSVSTSVTSGSEVRFGSELARSYFETVKPRMDCCNCAMPREIRDRTCQWELRGYSRFPDTNSLQIKKADRRPVWFLQLAENSRTLVVSSAFDHFRRDDGQFFILPRSTQNVENARISLQTLRN
jgi:hypothetical protein